MKAEPSTRVIFSRLAPDYERASFLERASGERLLDMLAVGPKDVVLDLGCGPGHLTRSIRGRTNGRLVGVDASAGMVAQARWNTRGLGITYQVCLAEDLDFDRTFNLIFCNSTLQWLTSPYRAVENCFRALRRGGWLGVQAPATAHWCSLAGEVAAAAASDPRTRTMFAHFRDPMFLLPTVADYTEVFTSVGFDVHDAWLEMETTRHTRAEALSLFETMAGAAYLNPDSYTDADMAPDPAPDQAGIEALRDVASDTIAILAAADGFVEVTVHRLYLFAVKPLVA
ncbi:MAG: methyltransferase domain-containing protein [Alphaproteobacteria bacterium]